MSSTNNQNEIKSQTKKVLAIDSMRGFSIDSENEQVQKLEKFDDTSLIGKSIEQAVEKMDFYFKYLKGNFYENYDCIVICCSDQLLKLEEKIENLCSKKLFQSSEIYIIGSRAPLFTFWFSQLNQKPNFGELIAVSRIKYANKEGMVCGLFTRYKTDDGKEFLAQIDGINTETNNFHELQAKIQGKMEIYSPTIPNVKIIYVAVYPDGYHFEDISNPKLVSQHFSHKDTDRAKGALIFGKNKVNGNSGDYIEIEENQKSEIKVMKDLPVSHSPTPSMRSLSRSSNIQTVVENDYQKNQQQKNIVGIDVGTMTCRAAIIYNKNDVIEKCGIVTMESKVTFSENQTNTYFEEEANDENEIDAKINQENTVFDIPHFIGKRIDQIIENPFLPYKIQKNRDFIKIQLQNNLILPEVACGELLKFIVRKVDEKFKIETTQISLITPIFNDSEAKKRYETALKCAAQLASLKVVNFIDSSTAALIDYIFKHTKNLIIGSFNIGVIDIGGSNLNIAVYNVNTNKDGFWLKEIFKYGNSKFGGRNVDILLAKNIKDEIIEITGSYNGGEFALLIKAEQMKIKLSINSSADYIHEKTCMTFKRDKEFQTCVQSFLETLKNELKIVEDQIKEESCKFLLIGNTCKIPAIKETIKKNFPNSVNEMNLSSAQGAAIHTAKLQKSYDKISYYKY